MTDIIEGELISESPAKRLVYVVRLLAGNPGRIEVYTTHAAALAFIMEVFNCDKDVTCLTNYTWVNSKRTGALLGFVLKQELHE